MCLSDLIFCEPEELDLWLCDTNTQMRIAEINVSLIKSKYGMALERFELYFIKIGLHYYC